MGRNINLIYFSATDTTYHIVRKIAEGISDNVKEHNLTIPANRKKELHFEADDVVIVGVPVYAGRVPGFLEDCFNNIKGNGTKAVFIAVYGDRAYEDALLELKDIFDRNGFIGIAGGAFIGEHSYTSKVGTGRPDEDDLKIAQDFGNKIGEKLRRIDANEAINALTVKGNFPYKEKGDAPKVAPVTDEKCTSCGICAKYCPMEAISFNDFKQADALKCIKCCSCIRRCPVGAKKMDNEFIKNITQRLIDNCSKNRCEPELFI